jgi:hypothetical protein
MQVPINNAELRSRKSQVKKKSTGESPMYEEINTRGINIITITKLLKGLDVYIAKLIKENFLDKYNDDVFIDITYIDRGSSHCFMKMSMIDFINYLTDPYTEEAINRDPSNSINEIIQKNLLYRSKKIIYFIYDNSQNKIIRFRNVFYDIHHHPEKIFDHNIGNILTGKTTEEKEMIGVYDVNGNYKLPIPYGTHSEPNYCSLNNLLDNYARYGIELPQCLILMGCRTLRRTNSKLPIVLVSSTRTHKGHILPYQSTVNQVNSHQNSDPTSLLVRSNSNRLHKNQYANFILNNSSFNDLNIYSYNNNNNNNNNNNIPNKFEFNTFRKKYLEKNSAATNTNIKNAYRRFMNKRLSFAMNISKPKKT